MQRQDQDPKGQKMMKNLWLATRATTPKEYTRPNKWERRSKQCLARGTTIRKMPAKVANTKRVQNLKRKCLRSWISIARKKISHQKNLRIKMVSNLSHHYKMSLIRSAKSAKS